MSSSIVFFIAIVVFLLLDFRPLYGLYGHLNQNFPDILEFQLARILQPCHLG